MQVSRGYSILDDEAPQGLRLRKWFLILLALLALIRGLFITIELALYNEIASSVQHALWLMRTLPSLLFLWTTAFLNDYLWQMADLLNATNTHVSTVRFLSFFLLIFLFVVALFYQLHTANRSRQVEWEHERSSYSILAVSGTILTCSLGYSTISLTKSLYQSTVANATKILARFLLLLCTQLVFVLSITIFRLVESLNATDMHR
jgi:hypothetical protein